MKEKLLFMKSFVKCTDVARWCLRSCFETCCRLNRLTSWTGACRYKQRQAQTEEEREKAFERVFNDPDVDLEEVAAQVRGFPSQLKGLYNISREGRDFERVIYDGIWRR